MTTGKTAGQVKTEKGYLKKGDGCSWTLELSQWQWNMLNWIQSNCNTNVAQDLLERITAASNQSPSQTAAQYIAMWHQKWQANQSKKT